MARTSTAHAAYARESVHEDVDDIQDQLFFSLPDGEPATFLFHNFENMGLTKRIFEHGGRITDVDVDADVILTKNREEYITLKDKYAISRKTHVRLSGFVDRCISARRFQLAPTVEKGVPGRKLMSRRTEFTKDDDEHLCQYIAEVLPDKGEGGRTGHFIYADLMRRADEFGQYKWAYRHPEGGWRERYRKNRDRMDDRIAQIVEENPPPIDGKGRYMYRRYGKINEDDELNANDDDDGPVGLDEEERIHTATDNEDSPVQIKKAKAQRQEEEEDDEDGEEAVMHQPEANSNLRSWYEERQEEESTKGQAAEQRPEKGRTRLTTRRSRVSLGEASGPKRRRTRAQQTALEEPRIPDGIDATLRGDTELDYNKPAEEPVPGPPPYNEAEIGKDTKKSKVRARRVVPPLSPRRTRALSRSLLNQPEAVPAASRTTPRAKAKATAAAATAATAALNTVPESKNFDEFVAHSDDDDDDGEMHEVEANLQITAHSRESHVGNQLHNSHRAEDLQTSRRVQGTAPSDTASGDPARDDLDDDDDDDGELIACVKKLDVHAPSVPAANLNRSGHRNRDQRSSSEEIFPSPGTRARAEKKRRTQAAKAAPYVPPKGTRAASMMEKEQARSQQAAVTTQIKQ